MENISIIQLFKIGFFIGIGWWISKVLFIIAITKYTGKPIELSKGEN